MQGTPGFSGYVNNGTGGSPPGTSDYTPFKYTAGVGAGPTVGLNTFVVPSLAGGSGLVVIFVSNVPETEGVDYTVNYTTGEVTRNNVWVANNTISGAFKSA
jgi:hypothetical protein